MAETPVLFNEPHDWRSNYNVQLAFATEILQSDDGTEQRIALRYMPVKTVTSASSTADEESRQLRSAMDNGLLKRLMTPQWTSVRSITNALSPGETVAVIPNRPYWMRTGYPVIFAYGKRMQIFNVVAMGTNSIGIDPPASGDTWPAGTRVYRALIGQPARPSMLSFNTAGAGQHSITFNVEPESELWLDDEGTAPMEYNGKEFFAPALDWEQPTTISFDQLADQIYYDRGVMNLYPRSNYGTRTLTARTYIEGENAADYWMQFFMRRRGRLVPFYMPTGQPDMVPEQDLAANVYLRHKGFILADIYDQHPVFRHVQVLLRDGTRLLRRVVSIVREGVETSLVQVDSAWPRAIGRSEILMVSWVTCCRMASDNILLEWQTQNYGTLGIAVQTLMDE